MRAVPGAIACLTLCSLASCTGSIDTNESTGEKAPATEVRPDPPDPGTPSGRAPSPVMGAGSAGLLPFRRLSRAEYSNTIEDLLGDPSRPGQALPEEGKGSSGFESPGPIGGTESRGFTELAESVAAAAVNDLGKLVACDPVKTGEDRCATQFIEGFGRRAYRRKLTAAEVATLQALYTRARKEWSYDFKGGVRFVLQAMLQSPSFLYRWELGATGTVIREGDLVRLNGDEVASRLSYMLWASMPDEALFRAADTGELGTPAGVDRQVRRMLADPRAKRALTSFHMQWLGLERLAEVQKDLAAYPDFSPGLKRAVEAELGELVTWAYQTGGGKLETLLTAPVGFVSGPLADFYGVKAAAGDAPEKRDLDPAQRAGILTSAAFLMKTGNTYESHPVRRGQRIYEDVLCGHIPPPPMNIPVLKPPAPNVSTRERYVQHGQDPACAACHRLFDGPGFAFEIFDGIGKHRTIDGGKPVDGSGSIVLPLGGESRSFRNALELVKILATSTDARRCVAGKWSRYALGREEIPEEKPSLDTAFDGFGKTGYDLRELIVGLTRSRAFLYRRPGAGEVLQ